MSILQPPWDQYLALQSQLEASATVDDVSWGREAALNRILASEALAPAGEVERAARSESRRERHRARLRRQHLFRQVDHVDGEAILKARQELRIVRAAVTDEEWSLATQVGEGVDYDEIAATTGVRAGTLRVRMRRVRQRLIALAA
jgi:DNA-directed RNA polymerase specialized sigma24 family protein